MIGETADCQNRTVQSNGREHNIDSRPIRESGIHNGTALIYHPVGLCHNLLNDILKLFSTFKCMVISEYLSVFFDKNTFRSVDHDLRHGLVLNDFLQNIKLADRVEQFPAEPFFFHKGEITVSPHQYNLLIDHFLNFPILHIPGKIHALQKMLTDVVFCSLISAHLPLPPFKCPKCYP